jgi:1,4-dihydroxy-2-naphthoate octaprenyltransferase
MKHVLRMLFWFRHLNIDVGIAAVTCSIMAFKVLNVNIHYSFWIILFLSTWSIYTIDHIFDGIKEAKQNQSNRYTFYSRNRKTLLIGIVNGFILFQFLDIRMVYAGIIMGTFSILYFLQIQKIIQLLPLPKDILSSLMFSIGIWVFPLFLNQSPIHFHEILFIVTFSFVVMINVLLYSLNDFEIDKKHKNQTLMHKIGETHTTSFMIFVFVVSYIFILLLIVFTDNPTITHSSIALIIMQLMHYIVFIKRDYFIKNERFFKIGNLIFIIPVIVLFF